MHPFSSSPKPKQCFLLKNTSEICLGMKTFTFSYVPYCIITWLQVISSASILGKMAGWGKKKKHDSTWLSSDKVKGIFWRTQYSSKPSPLQDLGTSWTPVLVEVIQNVCWALSKVLSRHCICSEHCDLPHWQQNPLLTSYVAKECWHFKISKLQMSKIKNELFRVKGTLLK